ncbi:FAD-dependent monooxygenase [Bounagaea algeriensis]
MRVLVIGGGIGGLAIANGLLARGHEVEVFEHAESHRTGGAGITMWSNGTAALRELGVDIEESGRRLHSLRSLTDSGRLLWEADLDAVTEQLGAPTVQIPRRVLMDKLGEQLPEGVVHFGRRCVGIAEHPDRVVATFANGSQATGDVLIGADGQRSAVRRSIVGGRLARPSGWASWQGLTATDLPVTRGHRTLNIAGRAAHAGLIPSGSGLLHWWFDMPWKDGEPVASVADLRRVFRGWPEPVEELLAAITDDDLSFFPHIRHDVPRVWGGERTTLLGDAVHAMPPAVAQAANQTIEDAWVLTECLDRGGSEPAPLLRTYEQERLPRVRKVSRTAALTAAQRNTPLQRLGKFPRWIATRSQVVSLRAGSSVLRGLTPPRPRLHPA